MNWQGGGGSSGSTSTNPGNYTTQRSVASTDRGAGLERLPPAPPSEHLQWAKRVRMQQGAWLREHRQLTKPRRGLRVGRSKNAGKKPNYALPSTTASVVPCATSPQHSSSGLGGSSSALGGDDSPSSQNRRK